MAVKVTAAQLAEYQSNLSGGKKLYPSAAKPRAKRRTKEAIRYERARASAAEHRATLLERRVNAPPKEPKLPKPPKPPLTRAQRAGNYARRSGTRFARNAGRTASRPIRRVGGGAATFLTLIIGTGVIVAIIRNPSFITAPFAFIGNITQAFASLTKK